MAQILAFTPYGGIQCEAGATYTNANVPTATNAVQLTRGVRITDSEGSVTPIRGVRVTITNNGLTPAATPLANIPFIWLEGEIIKFVSGASYIFQDEALVTFGKIEAL